MLHIKKNFQLRNKKQLFGFLKVIYEVVQSVRRFIRMFTGARVMRRCNGFGKV